jgi:hypothetical protein
VPAGSQKNIVRSVDAPRRPRRCHIHVEELAFCAHVGSEGVSANGPQSLDFKRASFSTMKFRMSDDISKSFSHCSLYNVMGNRPMP